MLKLLIVDDEALDRDGLVNQIKWSEFDIVSISTAKSGFDAMRKIKGIMPDILITDIKMPGMTGLKLAEQVKLIIPNIKVIFISGYDDFAFAREAIKIGAYEYILKPVVTEELIRAISKIQNICIKEKEENSVLISLQDLAGQSRVILKDKVLRDIVYGTLLKSDINKVNKLIDGISEGSIYTTVIVDVDDYKKLMEENDLSLIEAKLVEVNHFIMNFNSSECFINSFQSKPSRFVLLFIIKRGIQIEEIKNIVLKNARIISCKLNNDIHISSTIAVSDSTDVLGKIYQTYNQCIIMVGQKMFKGKGTILTDTIIEEEENKLGKICYNIEQELAKCIRNQDAERMNYLIDYLFENIKAIGVCDSKYVIQVSINILSMMEMTIYEMNEKIENIFGMDFYFWDKLLSLETISDIKLWIIDIFNTAIVYLISKEQNGNSKIIEKVKLYIAENYGKEISLKQIATEFFYSPNHLGLIIKEELGKGFSEYLTEYRMIKASEFLKEPNIRIYEVAEKVYYKNVAAFANRFKELFGVTPKQYKDRY